MVKGKRKYLGYTYATAEEAARAYDKVARGLGRRTNFAAPLPQIFDVEIPKTTGRLGLDLTSSTAGSIDVTGVDEGSVGGGVGLQGGDRILQIDGAEVASLSFDEAVAVVTQNWAVAISLQALGMVTKEGAREGVSRRAAAEGPYQGRRASRSSQRARRWRTWVW